MSLLVPDGNSPAQNETEPDTEPKRRMTWVDLALLALVLGSLSGLSLVGGMELPHAIALVGAGGLLTAELRRRLS